MSNFDFSIYQIKAMRTAESKGDYPALRKLTALIPDEFPEKQPEAYISMVKMMDQYLLQIHFFNGLIGEAGEAVKEVEAGHYQKAKDELGDWLWYCAVWTEVCLALPFEVIGNKAINTVWNLRHNGFIMSILELAELMKKHDFYNHKRITQEQVINKLAEALFYHRRLCQSIYLDWQDVADSNIEKLRQRWPEQFNG